MKCPECVAEGKRSTVMPGPSSTTLMASIPGYYDEDGEWVDNVGPNIITTPYSCSNGHRWSEDNRGDNE